MGDFSYTQMDLDMKETKISNGANLGFEEKMWKAADKLRNNMDAAEYKHVVLGLIFLKYISDAFEEVHNQLVNDPEKLSDPEEIDEYKMRNVFWVPPDARWGMLQKNAKQPNIGILVDNAMDAIERDNSSLKGVLPKNYGREALDKQRLGELIDLIGTIGLGDKESRSKDILHVMQTLGHKNIKNTLLYVQLAEELFRDQQEYISKVAKSEVDACALVDAGFDYVCDFDNAKIFRKKKH